MQRAIRIHIAASWRAEEFAQLYASANALYIFFALDSGDLNEVIGRHKRNLSEALERMDRRGGLESALGEIAGRLADARKHQNFVQSSALVDLFRQSIRDRFFDDSPAFAEVLSAAMEFPEWGDSDPIRILESSHWRNRARVPRSRAILTSERPSARELTVRRTHHNSPGFTDLAGFGEIVGHLKEFLIKLVDLYATREERQLKNARLRHENELAGLGVVEKKLSILAQMGCDKSALQQIAAELAPHVSFFREAAHSGQIAHVEEAEVGG